MKTDKLIATLLVVSSAYAMNAAAHDPKEHAKEKQAPNCAAMQEMEMGKMDKNDPVMMAMMKKCHKQMEGKHAVKQMQGMHKKDHQKNDDHTDDSDHKDGNEEHNEDHD